MGDFEAAIEWKKVKQSKRVVPCTTRRMETHSFGYYQRPCGVYATSCEGCYQGEGIPDQILGYRIVAIKFKNKG